MPFYVFFTDTKGYPNLHGPLENYDEAQKIKDSVKTSGAEIKEYDTIDVNEATRQWRAEEDKRGGLDKYRRVRHENKNEQKVEFNPY
jgi:hypothetical protein